MGFDIRSLETIVLVHRYQYGARRHCARRYSSPVRIGYKALDVPGQYCSPSSFHSTSRESHVLERARNTIASQLSVGHY